MPYFKIDWMKKSNTYLLWDLPGKLKSVSNLDGLMQEIDTMVRDSNVNDIIKDICNLAYSMYESQNLDLATNLEKYRKWLAEILDLNNKTLDKEKFEELISSNSELFYTSSQINQLFKILISELRYFTHKSIRDYFFRNHRAFTERLFRNFDKDVSKLNMEFQLNINTAAFEEVFIPSTFDHLKAEKDFDNQFIILNDGNTNGKILQKLQESFQSRSKNVQKYYNQIVNYLFPIIQEVLGEVKRPLIRIDNISQGSSLLQIYCHYNGAAIYAKYAERVHEGLKNLPQLKENDIDDLDDPKDFTELRWRLMILGYVSFNELIDRGEMDYVNYEGFTEKDRRLLLV